MAMEGDPDDRTGSRAGAPASRYGEPLSGILPESPAAERNKEPILEVLKYVLPPKGAVLEIASGTGQHIVHFAAALPQLAWQPTDPDPDLLNAIRCRVEAAALANLRLPLQLDVLEEGWPVSRADAVLCANMIHIAPWAATEGLLRGAAATLPAGAPLVLYGPYRRAGVRTAPSNEAFDASLKARNSDWGLRDFDEVAAVARRYAFSFAEIVEMPANNLIVVFKRE